jgi:hypothetical protein
MIEGWNGEAMIFDEGGSNIALDNGFQKQIV